MEKKIHRIDVAPLPGDTVMGMSNLAVLKSLQRSVQVKGVGIKEGSLSL